MMRKHLFKALHFSVKNTIRALFFTAVMAAFAMGMCWFLALKYFNAQNVGGAIARELGNALQRPVVIGSIKLVSINSIEIKKFKVVDTKLNTYNDFLSADSVIVRYDLLPLLKNKVEIKEIILQNPVVNIIKDENGVLNTPDFITSTTQSSRGQQFDVMSSAGRAFQIVIEDWTINNGTFSYRDLGADISHSLNGIFIHFYNLKFNALTDFNMHFVLRNKVKDKIIETEAEAQGAVNLANFKAAEMALENTKAKLGAFRKPLLITLQAHNFVDPQINFKTNIPQFGYDDVSLFMPRQIDFTIPAVKAEAQINFNQNFKKITISSLKLDNKDVKLRLNGAVDLQAEPVFAQADFSTNEFNIAATDYLGLLKKFDFTGKASAQGSFVYEGGKAKLPKLTVNLNNAAAKISNFIISGVKGKYEASDNLNLMKADVADGVFKVGRQTISKIKGNASYDHKKQNFYAFVKDAMFNDKKIRIRVTIDKVRTHERDIQTAIYLSSLSPLEVYDTVEDFVYALDPNHKPAPKETGDLAWLHNFRADLPKFMPNFSGIVHADTFTTPIVSGKNFNAEFVLKNLLPGMDKLDGKIDASLEDGIIYKLQEAAERQAALGVAFQPFVIMNKMERAGSFKMGQVLKDTPFETMTASVDFNNGKMNINNFYVDGSVVAATVGGSVDWVGEVLNLDIATMFRNTSKRGALSENLTDESGDPALAFKALSTMKKPTIQMRSSKKTGEEIQRARKKGLRTDFKAGQNFIKEK